jgi:hypothetical protein
MFVCCKYESASAKELCGQWMPIEIRLPETMQKHVCTTETACVVCLEVTCTNMV